MSSAVESDPRLPAPPEASERAAALARRILSPVESFLHIEASSGIVLLVATAVAMLLANSRWGPAYEHFLHAPVGVHLGGWTVAHPVHFWVNEGLMTIFFFVVGLEIRREIHEGELATPRRAALPAAAAIGGMLVPAAIYSLVAGWRPENRSGWGVPMATDIAFAVGVLALLGRRVPAALRVLLLALAIIDDIGGILVIALFYSGDVRADGLLVAAAGVALVLVMQRLGVRRPALYVLPGFVVWMGALRSGVHPAIAGVIVGLLTPPRPWLGAAGVLEITRRTTRHVDETLARGTSIDRESILARAISQLDLARREALSPAARLQAALHPWVAFGIMPLFAFANAGVRIESFDPTLVTGGIVAGLVLGKPLGILAACALALRLRIATLPRGIGFRELVVLGIVAGIGFTMALFIAALAFADAARLADAKLGVLLASAAALVIGLAAGRFLLAAPGREEVDVAQTPLDAETSDEK